jgi:hypothetical protein
MLLKIHCLKLYLVRLLNGNIHIVLLDCIQLCRHVHLWASPCGSLKNTKPQILLLLGGGGCSRTWFMLFKPSLNDFVKTFGSWSLSLVLIWKVDLSGGPSWGGTCLFFYTWGHKFLKHLVWKIKIMSRIIKWISILWREYWMGMLRSLQNWCTSL